MLDTETTGLSSKRDKMIEIGCVEVIEKNGSYELTGRNFHEYLDPAMEISTESTRIHGLTNDMLSGKPQFADIESDLVNFIEGGTLVIHNANFDLSFLNNALQKPIENDCIDTLKVARKLFPGKPCSLDALCNLFQVSLSNREKHGALIDSKLLAQVFINLSQKAASEGMKIESVCDDLFLKNIAVKKLPRQVKTKKISAPFNIHNEIVKSLYDSANS